MEGEAAQRGERWWRRERTMRWGKRCYAAVDGASSPGEEADTEPKWEFRVRVLHSAIRSW